MINDTELAALEKLHPWPQDDAAGLERLMADLWPEENMSPERFDELRANAESATAMLSIGDVVECLDEIARLADMVYVPGGLCTLTSPCTFTGAAAQKPNRAGIISCFETASRTPKALPEIQDRSLAGD